MDTDAPQVSHKPGGEPKIKVSGWYFVLWLFVCLFVEGVEGRRNGICFFFLLLPVIQCSDF